MTVEVLIVEDDENLRIALQDNLEQESYRVCSARNGEQAQQWLDKQRFDVIVLDIMLPDGDGYQLCRRWRKKAIASMIIMLTARSLEEDIVKGFEAGADDYLIKPYRLTEFLLRVRALARRANKPLAETLALPGFRIDADAHQVSRQSGEAIELTAKEYDLLMCLIANRNSALTRNHILDEVWGQDVVVDARTVDNFVSNLKKKLGWHANAGFRIATIRGVGYRMEIDE